MLCRWDTRPSAACAQLVAPCPPTHWEQNFSLWWHCAGVSLCMKQSTLVHSKRAHRGQIASVKITISSGLCTMRKAGKEKGIQKSLAKDGQMFSEASAKLQLCSGTAACTEQSQQLHLTAEQAATPQWFISTAISVTKHIELEKLSPCEALHHKQMQTVEELGSTSGRC